MSQNIWTDLCLLLTMIKHCMEGVSTTKLFCGYCNYYIRPIGDRPVHFLWYNPNHFPKPIPNLNLTQYVGPAA